MHTHIVLLKEVSIVALVIRVRFSQSYCLNLQMVLYDVKYVSSSCDMAATTKLPYNVALGYEPRA